MIQSASKYADVRAESRKAPCPSSTMQRAAGTSRRRSGSSPGAPALLVPKHAKLVNWNEWMWRELREGGRLHEYLRAEKAGAADRLRAVARYQHRTGWKQNNKSDFRLLFRVPARDYARWKKVDPHFWDDDSNLRSYKRDNPDACIYT